MTSRSSTNRLKRIFGLSLLQIVILACLACLAFGIGAGGLAFLATTLGGNATLTFETNAQTPQPISTIPPTTSPAPTATFTPTPTSYADTIPDGWLQFRDNTYFGYEVWFPPEYTAIDPRGKLEEEIKAYEDSGDSATALLLSTILEEEVPHYTLWTADTLPTPLRYQTNISLATYPLKGTNLAAFIDTRIKNLPVTTRLMERKPHVVGSYPAERLWLESSLSNTSLGQAVYFISAGGQAWVITCRTHFNEFYPRLPIFDQIAATFRTLEP